jgi:hypothetical protein
MRIALLAVLVAACGGDDGGVAPAGGDGGTHVDSSTGGLTGDAAVGLAAKEFCVSETNRYRAMLQKPALTESMTLEAYADTGAMVDFGSSPHNHFTMTSGGGISFAENECPQQGNWNLSFGNGDLGMTVGFCILQFFQEGPGGGHYENMMGPYAMLGCGIYVVGQQLTIVQDYGN